MNEKIKIGDFVWIHHPHAWEKANDLGVLSPEEITRKGYVTGQVIGTYGHWDGIEGSKFHWDIIPDCWISAKFHVMKVLASYSIDKKFSPIIDGFDGEKYKEYVQSIIPELSVGSCQLEPDRVAKDLVRCRNWELMKISNDFSELEKVGVHENVIEKAIVDQAFESFKKKQWKAPTITTGFGSMCTPV